VCDAVRGILDGHIILSRQLGAAGHYPAIDVLQSVSRLQAQISTDEQKFAAQKVRAALAAYRDAEDLINLGAYVSGSNPKLDQSIAARPKILEFLRQEPEKNASRAEALDGLKQLAAVLS
jgi:flagellar biosynthesis/type III secretory pathway ATPase